MNKKSTLNKMQDNNFSFVYLLQHSYEQENTCEETKILGIFSTLEKANEAIIEYKKLPGFKNKPDDFCVDKYSINKKYWIDGFVNW